MRIVATTGWVEDRAIIGACQCEKGLGCDCKSEDIRYALADKKRGILADFGDYDFVMFQLMSIRDVNRDFIPFEKPLYEILPLENRKMSFPMWAAIKAGDIKKKESLFQEDRMIVYAKKEKALGFIDRDGKPAGLAKYIALSDFRHGKAMAALKDDFGKVDLDGRYESDGVKCILSLGRGRLAVSKKGEFKNISLDLRMQMMTMVLSQWLQKMNRKEKAIINTEDFCRNAQWAILTADEKAQTLTPFQYSAVKTTYWDGYYFVYRDGKVGLLDHDGKEVFKPTYHSIVYNEATEFLAVQREKNGKYQLYKRDGSFVALPPFDDFHVAERSLLFKVDGKWGLADINGRVLLEPNYPSVKYVFKTRQNRVINDGANYAFFDGRHYQIFDRDGKQLPITDIEEVTAQYRDMLIASRRGRFGVINIDNEVIVPFKYDGIDPFDSGRAVARIGGISTYVYRSKEAKQMWQQKAQRERQEAIQRQRAEEKRQREAAAQRERQRRESIQRDIDRMSWRITQIDYEITECDHKINNDVMVNYYRNKRENLRIERRNLRRQLREKERQRLAVAVGF